MCRDPSKCPNSFYLKLLPNPPQNNYLIFHKIVYWRSTIQGEPLWRYWVGAKLLGKQMCFTVLLVTCLWQGTRSPVHPSDSTFSTTSTAITSISLYLSPHQLVSKHSFFRQNSERRSFKAPELRKTNRDAGISSPSRISPASTPSSPDDTPCLSGDPYNRRRRKIPKVWKI